MTLDKLNTLALNTAQDWFMQCCAAETWFHQMAAKRPYANSEELVRNARQVWQSCDESDYLQAFLAHPMIGDVNSLREKYANTLAIASNEQSGTQEANEHTLQALSKLNHQYLAKHGFIFIICASGLSAEAMLQALQTRMANTRERELTIAADEQLKITLLRLKKGLISEPKDV